MSNEWQPIATAPQEHCVDVLLYDIKQDYWSIGWRFDDEPDWITPIYVRDFKPTHWIPIPKPPTQ
jgi:hypothetical protein